MRSSSSVMIAKHAPTTLLRWRTSSTATGLPTHGMRCSSGPGRRPPHPDGVAWRRQPAEPPEDEMLPISAERYYTEIEASTDTLARLVDGADLTRTVPTCPDWTLRQL